MVVAKHVSQDASLETRKPQETEERAKAKQEPFSSFARKSILDYFGEDILANQIQTHSDPDSAILSRSDYFNGSDPVIWHFTSKWKVGSQVLRIPNNVAKIHR